MPRTTSPRSKTSYPGRSGFLKRLRKATNPQLKAQIDAEIRRNADLLDELTRRLSPLGAS